MPIYEYKGQQYDISTDDPALAKQKILKHLGLIDEPTPETPPVAREKTKWYEDIGSGLVDTGTNIAKALGTAAAGLTTGDRQQEIIGDVQGLREAEKTHEATVDRGEVGKVLKAVGGIPAYLNPVSGGLAIVGGGVETGAQLADEGADARHVSAGFNADVGLNALVMRAMGGLNVAGPVKNALLQGGANVAQETLLNRPVQNIIRTDAELPDLPNMTSGDYAAQFVPGATIGAMTARPRTSGHSTPEVDPSLTETRQPSVADLDSGVVTQKKAIITSIDKQIQKLQLQQAELASNGPMSEKQYKFYQSLQKQIDFKQGEIRKEVGLLSKYESNKPNQTPEELAQVIQELDITAPKETVESFSKKTGEELGGVSHLTGLISQLQEVYIKQGPEQGQALLEDMANRAPESSGFSIEVGTRGFVDELHAELTKRAEQYKGRKVGAGGTASEVVRTPQQELVSPETRTQGSMFEFSPDGGRVYLKDRARAEALRDKLSIEDQFVGDTSPEAMYKQLASKQKPKQELVSRRDDAYSTENLLARFSKETPKLRPIAEIAKELRAAESKYSAMIKEGDYGPAKLVAREVTFLKREFFAAKAAGKQKGSWTPFAGEEPRPDDSDAPGAMPVQPKKGFPFRKPIAEAVYPDFSDPRVKQPPQEGGKTLAEWEAEINQADKEGLERTSPYQEDNPPKGGPTLDPAMHLSKLEVSLAKINTLISKEEGNIKNGGANSGTVDIHSLYKSRASLEARIERVHELSPNLRRGGEKELGKPKKGSKFSSKDDADQSTKKDSVFPEDAERLRQQLLNEGKSERAADVEVEKQYPSHPVFGQGKIPPKESGMWTPFQSSRDVNEKKARAIAKSVDLDQNIDVTKMFSAKDILERNGEAIQDSSGSTLSAVEREFSGRGQFVEANKRAQPIVWEIAKRLKAAKDNEIANKRGWWSGTASKLAVKTFGPFMKLSHYDDPQTPSHVKLASTNKDRIAISEYMQLAQKEHVNHIQKESPNLTEGQRRVLDTFNNLSPFQQSSVKVFTTMLEQIRATRKIPYLAGFIPHIRKGDFAVYLKTSQGDPAHLETFTSKTTADAWIKQAKEKGYDVSDIVDFKTPEGQTLAESFGLVRDIMDSLNSNDPKRQVWINKIMDDTMEKVSRNPDIGKHREHFTGLSGFMGTKLFKNRLDNANDFFKSMEEYAQSSAAQHKKVEIIRAKNQFWDNPEGRKLREKFPNQSETADFLVDVAMNKDQKYGWTDSVDKIRTRVDEMYTKMRQNVRTKLGKDPDLLYYPEVPILDRVTGAGAQLFYISALTTRPGFWVGQALTSPFAIRQFLKEGTIADTLVSQGKGWGTVMTGGDVEWKAFVKDMANQSDSVHPQFINEINTLPGLSKMSSLKLDKLVEVVTGQRPAGMADAVSRYTVAAMAYHHYKNLGMKGEQLASNVRKMVDDTMVMYDREHSPSVFNKMGLVGQNIAPLQKYGLAQLENLIGDLKFIAQRPEGMGVIRSMAPAISTLLTTMIMAGSVGLPLLMEYEMLRAGFVEVSKFFGWDDVEDYVPGSVLEVMLTNDKILTTLVEAGMEPEIAQKVRDATTHGVLSAGTGHDIGSSLRFNPYAPGADQNGQVSALSAFPVIKFIADIGSIAGTKIRKHTAGDVTEAEDRNATLKVQPFIGSRAALDATMFDAGNRDYVPGGIRGYAQVEQTPQEQIGMLIGAKPLETAKKNAALQVELKHDKKVAAMKQKAVDLLVDGLTHDKEDKIEKAYSMAIRAEMTPKQLQEQVKSVMHERRTPRWEDRFTNRKGQVKSTQQKQRFERADKYE